MDKIDIVFEILDELSSANKLNMRSGSIDEAKYEDRNKMWLIFVGFAVTMRAKNKAKELFSSNDLVNGKGDAFRHGLWSALLSNQFGEEASEFVTSEYEKRTGTGDLASEMDYINNKIGRKLGVALNYTSFEEIENRIKIGVDNGEFLMFTNM